MPLSVDKFKLTGEARRNLFVTFVNVGKALDGADRWEPQGYKTEETALEFNPDIETLTDVLGVTYATLNKFEESIEFEPNTVRMGAELSEILHYFWRNDMHEKFSQFQVAQVYGYIEGDVVIPEETYAADIWKSCTIVPNSLGGSSRVDMPFRIDYGGEKVKANSTGLKAGAVITPVGE